MVALRVSRLVSIITGDAGPAVERTAVQAARTRPSMWFYAPLLVGLIAVVGAPASVTEALGSIVRRSGGSGGFAPPDSAHERDILDLLRDGPNGLHRSGTSEASDGGRWPRGVLRLDPAAAQAKFARRFHLQKPLIVERVRGLRCSGRFARDYIVETWGNHSTRYGSSAGIVLNRGNGPLEARLDRFLEHQRSRTLSAARRAKAMATAAAAAATWPKGAAALEFDADDDDDDDATGAGGGEAAKRSVLERIYAPSAADEAAGGGAVAATATSAHFAATAPESLHRGAAPYGFDRYAEPIVADLLQGVDLPRIFPSGAERGYHSYLLLGTSGGGIEWHMHSDGWNALACGHKRWFLLPPGTKPPNYPRPSQGGGVLEWYHRFYADFAALEGAREAVQRPGDVLYIPEGWYHATINVGETLGVSAQLIRPRTAELAALFGTTSVFKRIVEEYAASSRNARKRREIKTTAVDVALTRMERVVALLPAEAHVILADAAVRFVSARD